MLDGFNIGKRYQIIIWFFKIAPYYDLDLRTIYLTISFFDQYIKKRPKISDKQVLLLATTCVFVASKVDEDINIAVDSIMYLLHGKFGKTHLYGMEIELLHVLDYRTHPDTLYDVPYLTRDDMYNIILTEHGILTDLELVKRYFWAVHVVQKFFRWGLQRNLQRKALARTKKHNMHVLWNINHDNARILRPVNNFNQCQLEAMKQVRMGMKYMRY